MNLPQEMFEKDGKKNFFPLVKFEDTSALKKFEKEFFMALEQFTKKQSTPFGRTSKTEKYNRFRIRIYEDGIYLSNGKNIRVGTSHKNRKRNEYVRTLGLELHALILKNE